MPRGPAPEWTRRKEPVLDHYLQASIDLADGIPDPETGHYGLLHYTGINDRERAKEIKRALYRAGRHVGVSVHAEIVRADDKTFTVAFRSIDKTHAKKYILAKYGTDRSNWPYDPRRRNQ